MLSKILKEHNVATTSLLANFWKNEAKSKKNWPALCQELGESDKDLFKDSFMQHFVSPEVASEADARLDKRMWLPLATRTRFFRRTISDCVKNLGIEQILLLGSGFDTLPVRKSKYTKNFGTKFFEVDQPQVLACKASIYSKYGIEKNAEYIGIDYTQGDLIEELRKHSLDFNRPTLILWEGNTFYLEKEEVIRIITELSSHFRELILTFDFMQAAMQNDTEKLDKVSGEKSLEKTLNQFAKSKSPFKAFFDPAEIISICEKLGIICFEHKTAAALAIEYQVDKKPYYTAETYSLITLKRAT